MNEIVIDGNLIMTGDNSPTSYWCHPCESFSILDQFKYCPNCGGKLKWELKDQKEKLEEKIRKLELVSGIAESCGVDLEPAINILKEKIKTQ